MFLTRGAVAAAVAGAALGTFWGWALPGNYGFFGVFLGIALGYGVGEPVSLATNRKFGPPLQVVAALGVALAYVVRNLVIGDGILPADDLGGYIAVGVGMLTAVNRLRF